MDTGLTSQYLYSACKVTAAFHYAPSDNRFSGTGTGFIVQNRQSQLVFITNRHVVDQIWLRGEAAAGTALEGLTVDYWENSTTRVRLALRPDATEFHSDPTVDVAAVTLETNILGVEPAGHHPTIEYFVPWTQLHGHYMQFSSLIEAGELIVMPGYPEWADQSGRPIFRTGAIVSDPQQDYRLTSGEPTIRDGNHQILFEAFSTSGNSGSPVYVSQRGQSVGAGLTYNGTYHPPLLVGINAGHMVDIDPASETHRRHVGLSRMYKTSAILQLPNFNN